MLGKGETLVRVTLVVCALIWACTTHSSAMAASNGYVGLDRFLFGPSDPSPSRKDEPTHRSHAEDHEYKPLIKPRETPQQSFSVTSQTDSHTFVRLPDLIELQAQPPAHRFGDLPFRREAAARIETLSTRSSPVDPPLRHDLTSPDASQSGIHGLRGLIGWAEAGRAGYDAVVLSARIKPERAPTEMTLHEIFLWIERTPRQNHAIGRYQFIPDTLRRLVTKLDIAHSQRFSAALQDRLANALLIEAGLAEFIQGLLPRKAFMNNLADIWAGLPTSNGKSRYNGYAGNKAVITWHRFAQAMEVFFPS